MTQKRVPPKWRRRMGTAFIFLLVLDFVIVFPTFTAVRIDFAAVVTVIVLAAIAAIWRRNTALERVRDAGLARTK